MARKTPKRTGPDPRAAKAPPDPDAGDIAPEPDRQPLAHLVLAIAFLAGAALMALEIVGGRIVAARFGSHIFVWGALIGIFMGALSLGYYLGGRLSDRRPSFAALGGVLLASGAAIFLVPWIADPVCSLVASLLFTNNVALANRWNPTAAIVLVFGLPAVLLGSVTPFTVRLLAREIGTMGRVAARAYALNALGSIAGTFLTAFILMGFLGNTAILTGLAVAVLALGAGVLLAERFRAPAPGQAPESP